MSSFQRALSSALTAAGIAFAGQMMQVLTSDAPVSGRVWLIALFAALGVGLKDWHARTRPAPTDAPVPRAR